MTLILPTYLVTILIWGSTWYVLTFQLGRVSVELSIAYRFFLAAGFFFLCLGVQRRRLRARAQDHLFFALQGFFMYCASYLCIYNAAHYISSGLNSITFSFVIVLNVLFVALLFKTPLQPKLLLSAGLGVLGILCIFLPEVSDFSFEQGHGWGIALSLLACTFSALGNVVIQRNRHLPLTQVNAYSMLYGALFSFFYAVIQGHPIVFDTSPQYILSLLYLAFFGSFVAFGCYTRLINHLGADRGGYPFVMIPLVSLLLSEIFEGFTWSISLGVGLFFILLGNALIVSKANKYPSPRAVTQS